MLVSLSIHAQEICGNRIDDDNDGLVDCLDPDCSDATECWQCLTEFYQVHSNSKLVVLDPAFGTYSLLGNISGATQINGAQMNPVDGHVYAPCVINGLHRLGMLGRDGAVLDTGIDLPGNGIFYVGAFSLDGVMYLSNGLGIHSIDLNLPNPVVVNTGVAHPGVADFSLDATNGLFYGIAGGGKLKVFNPYDLSVSTYDLAGSISSESGGFGAAWSCVDGSFFAYNNSSGKIYSVDVEHLTSTLVLNGTGNLSINDGFNCVNAAPPFESDCGDGIDEDGDGLADCDDVDCFSSNQCTLEICNNGIDDDNDGWVDCSDSECYTIQGCFEICDNGLDDNGNGLVDSADPQCGTSAGVTGGLESNRRLSGKIANRNFTTMVRHAKEYQEKISGKLPYVERETRTPFDVSALIPTEVLNAEMAESTPINLTGVTNADEVVAADYYVGEQRVASALAIYSVDGVYEHTKYICDRLDGARLLDVSYLNAMDGNFISYELLNKEGQLEYAVSFAAWHEEGEGFHIENHWNLHEFTEGEDFYNMQLWAQSYEDLIVLLETSLEQFAGAAPIASIVHSGIPRVFVMQGDYHNGELRLVIKNKIQSPSLTFHGELTREEGGLSVPVEYQYELSGSSEEVLTIETGFLYDIGAAITCPGSADDAIFLADGAWGIDTEHAGAEIEAFSVFAQEPLDDEDYYQVERSVSVQANVLDYLNIYRSLDPNLNAIDLTAYNSLAFQASGQGMMELTVVRASVGNWQDQFRTTLELSTEGELVTLFAHDFESSLGDMSFNDITMLVFTLLGDQEDYKSKSLSISDLRFQNSIASSLQEAATDLSANVYPNPVIDYARMQFSSVIEAGDLVVRDVNGKMVHRSSHAAGRKIEFDLGDIPEGIYFYELEGGSGIQASGRLLKVERK